MSSKAAAAARAITTTPSQPNKAQTRKGFSCVLMANSWLKWLILQMAYLLLLISLPANAIIVRHDTGYGRFIASESDYPAVFPLLRTDHGHTCVASLIAERWALTAAHCVLETGLTQTLSAGETFAIEISGAANQVVRVIFHPRWPGAASTTHSASEVDLALLELSRPARDVSPLAIYNGHAEAGRQVTFLGWGSAGMGSSADRFRDGRLRFARNTVLTADAHLHFEFDDPAPRDSRAIPFEGIPGLGDSGGPALLPGTDTPVLVGVAVGELGGPERSGRYGAHIIYERVSLHTDWIAEHVEGVRVSAL